MELFNSQVIIVMELFNSQEILTAVASLERETRQEQDGSKVSSLTFVP